MEQEYLKFAKNIAYKAGEIMMRYFNEDNGATYKYDRTIVTKADTEINAYLVEKVKEFFPSHCVDGEEKQFGKSEYVWVCDPVDGTAMYARHIPIAVFSLALVINGTPVIGVVYDPFTDNLYSAIIGQGAYRNNEKINVNTFDLDDNRTVCHFDVMPKPEYYNTCAPVNELLKKAYFVSLGSIIRAGICVANGEFTVAVYPGVTHKNCDIAAIKVIVEEAGGKVTDLFGNTQRYDQDIKGAIISNGITHDEIVNLIKKYKIELF